jgi:hypothetical protein
MSAIAWQRSLEDALRAAGDGGERLVLMDFFNPT